MASAPRFPDARRLLARHGLVAKKSWGQNFLVAESVFAAIVDATVTAADDWIVEIGAGLGTLTARLAARVPAGKVIAVERERTMLGVLRADLGEDPRVEIRDEDALTCDLSACARRHGRSVVVCGNLPYQIATPLLFHVLEHRHSVSHAVVMVQREVADRLLARPATRAYGALGAVVGAIADVTQVARAGPGAFVPRPRVDSTVVCVRPLAAPRVPIADEAHYRAVVHAAFGQRRKTLRNALRAVYDEAAVDHALTATSIDGRRRGETLAVTELAVLAAALPRAARRE
jgi:16S rRNA (adenine1518-N6/adenine1519-N6)-dimethyltransferase